jgi:GMP synthase-like glutamine amidotransferase
VNRIHFIQHVPFESPARIAGWARERGLETSLTRVFEEPLPAAEDVEALVVMGGPMSVHDAESLPWLTEEKRLIEAVVRADKPVLGVCLGAQLIADVLGARVHRNRFQEIGWFRVEATAAGRNHAHFPLRAEFVPFHWHGDTFELPSGAVQLARSAACEQQAFAWGERVLGLQFHLEMDAEGVSALAMHCGAEAGSGPYVQSPEEMLALPARFDAAHALLEELLDHWKEERHDDQA